MNTTNHGVFSFTNDASPGPCAFTVVAAVCSVGTTESKASINTSQSSKPLLIPS